MKILFLFLYLFLTHIINAQLKPGFDKNEAKDLIQLCNSFTYLDLYKDDSEIIPTSYTKVYTSPTYGLDNLFQVYEKEGVGIINFRGSTAKKSSWLENLYASMIPVQGKIKVNGKSFDYQVGKDTAGAVHAGYVLALNYLHDDLLNQIKNLNNKGIYNILITGHSQGGALAQMTRAYLAYVPQSKLAKQNTFKVYAFANPMIGNQAFCNEYSKKFCSPEMSFVIHNPDDFVPRMPISYNDSTFWQSQLTNLMMDREGFSKTTFAIEGLTFLFKDKIQVMAKKMATDINAQIIQELGDIEMPKFKNDINYSHTGNRMLISATEYPLELKDASILQNDSLMKIYKRDKNGVFEDKSLYKKPSWSLQHKPYNYYTALLKDHFPEEYLRLEKKYFVMPE